MKPTIRFAVTEAQKAAIHKYALHAGMPDGILARVALFQHMRRYKVAGVELPSDGDGMGRDV